MSIFYLKTLVHIWERQIMNLGLRLLTNKPSGRGFINQFTRNYAGAPLHSQGGIPLLELRLAVRLLYHSNSPAAVKSLRALTPALRGFVICFAASPRLYLAYSAMKRLCWTHNPPTRGSGLALRPDSGKPLRNPALGSCFSS